jgi:NAD(P)-dependent dehydrogenase (short-subunit alcohol dehydrogenase family)
MNVQSSRLFSLEGQVIVLTGGYGNIGRALALGCADLGAKIAVVEPAIKPNAEFEASDRIAVFDADVTQRDTLVEALEKIKQKWGAPTGLINNAALDSPPGAPLEENGPFETYPEASWDKVMAVNAKGPFLCAQVFGAEMARAGGGSIINVASIYGSVSPDQGLYEYRRARGEQFYKPVAYSASKSALYNLTRYLAVYWGPQNVRVNTVTFAGVFNNQDAEFLSAYAKKIPLRRGAEKVHLHNMAEPNDYLGPIVFLLSGASGYMTGADLCVDGGFLAV